jgi:hypothetical protein
MIPFLTAHAGPWTAWLQPLKPQVFRYPVCRRAGAHHAATALNKPWLSVWLLAVAVGMCPLDQLIALLMLQPLFTQRSRGEAETMLVFRTSVVDIGSL